ncbi:MAG: tRNA preQ1(34) S-adenosylmethionine ribosyltransferase-isomerase QueA [Pyrinomonadaceae bacterium]
MLISDFDYELPSELIAQEPLSARSDSRMLTVSTETKTFEDKRFIDFPTFIKPGDLVVLNNTQVFPARLIGNTETGGKIELFLIEETEEYVWQVLARPAKRLKQGKRIIFGEALSAIVLDKNFDGTISVNFQCNGNLNDAIDQIGKTPLPPYIKRGKDKIDRDRKRYQTVYAQQRGAIAAPTAGLHFTPETFNQIKQAGAKIVEITLHVGYGTFEPVRVDQLSLHRVKPERYLINEDVADLLNAAKKDNRRIIAIGTTTTRALEAALQNHERFTAGAGFATLTITPGYKYRAVDALLTNFHLPCSSLLVLVSTFGGHKLIMEAYNHAVCEKYRFYSYGDCMFIY